MALSLAYGPTPGIIMSVLWGRLWYGEKILQTPSYKIFDFATGLNKISASCRKLVQVVGGGHNTRSLKLLHWDTRYMCLDNTCSNTVL